MLSISIHFRKQLLPQRQGRKRKYGTSLAVKWVCEAVFSIRLLGWAMQPNPGACSLKQSTISKSKPDQASGLVSKYLWCFCVPRSESLFYRDAVDFFFNLLIVFDKHCFCLWAPMFSSQEGAISSSNLIFSCHIPKHLDQLPPRWPLLYLASTYLLEMQTVLFWKYEKMLDSPVLWTTYSIS